MFTGSKQFKEVRLNPGVFNISVQRNRFSPYQNTAIVKITSHFIEINAFCTLKTKSTCVVHV